MKVTRIFLILAVFLSLSLSNALAIPSTPIIHADGSGDVTAAIVHNDLIIEPPVQVTLSTEIGFLLHRGDDFILPGFGASSSTSGPGAVETQFVIKGTANWPLDITMTGDQTLTGVTFYPEWKITNSNTLVSHTYNGPGTAGVISTVETMPNALATPFPYSVLNVNFRIMRLAASLTAPMGQRTATFTISADYQP